jgi:hypothetical protein
MSIFSKETTNIYHVVELDRDSRLPEITADLRESLKALALNPAFNYLLQRFRVKKSAMEATLREGFKLDEQQLRYCQAGIFWAGEIERDLKSLTQTATQSRPATRDELSEFKKIASAIQLVGQD